MNKYKLDMIKLLKEAPDLATLKDEIAWMETIIEETETIIKCQSPKHAAENAAAFGEHMGKFTMEISKVDKLLNAQREILKHALVLAFDKKKELIDEALKGFDTEILLTDEERKGIDK